MGNDKKPNDRSGLVTASEIAAFVYCEEAWRLEHGLGLKPANRAYMDADTRHHERKAAAERIAGGSITVGRFLAVLAAVALPPASLVVVVSLPAGWIALAAFLALLVGLWLMVGGRGMRKRRGLGGGKTVSLDRITLTSHRLGLTGRPDRLIKANGSIIVEE